MLNDFQKWLDRIKTANSNELTEIQEEWIMEGENYPESNWFTFWHAFTERELELEGIDPNQPAF